LVALSRESSKVLLTSCPFDLGQTHKFAEDSREEMREVVRKKLDLDKNVRLELVQVREGKLYDLEDGEIFS
jgi:hypothetical protein